MRAPTEAEIARHLGLELGAYQTLLDDVQGVQIIHYEDLVRNGNGAELADHASLAARPRASWANPLGKLMAKGLREAFAAAIADRTSVVEGKRGSVRVKLGGPRKLKK